jgi:hypothetical protein
MFVITDHTRWFPHETVSIDCKDVRDIIIGITGDETIANKYYEDICSMHFGDMIVAKPYFTVQCVLDCE